MISAVFGATFLIRRSSLREMADTKNPIAFWLLAFAAWMAFVTFGVSVSTDYSVHWLVQWTKMAIVFPLLLAGVLRTRAAFNLFIAAHMLGALWWGHDAWTRPKRAQGRLINIGSGDTLSDNAASAHLITVLPFVILYLLTEKDKRLRIIALVAAPFVINTLILCNSRGAMVGLAVAMMTAICLIKSQYRFRLIATGVACALSFFMLADRTFVERQQTTTKYEDGSAQGRLSTWKGSLGLFKDHPLGTGGRGFHLLSPVYIPDVVAEHDGEMRAPHNTVIMVTAEWGIPGLICFLGWHIAAFRLLQGVKRRVQGVEADHNFFYWRALALQLALISGFVAGLFTDRLYGESSYWMLALTFALHRIQITDAAERAAASAPVPAPAASASTGWHWSTAGARAR